jgi:chemotaxis protein MotB
MTGQVSLGEARSMLRIHESQVSFRALAGLIHQPAGEIQAMAYFLKRSGLLLPLMASVLLSACVSQSAYDQLQAQNQQLQQQNSALSAQVAADKAQICRLQGAIKYTVNSDLLFPSGGWQMSDRGKQIIGNMASKLAPTQQNKVLVSGYTDNAPIGRALQREGITSNQILSQKRAENVMEFLISQGLKPDLVSAKGLGETDPVASNATPQGRAQNRRVELSVPASGC